MLFFQKKKKYFWPFAARSLKRTKNTGRSKLGFWDLFEHCEVEGGRNFGSGYVSHCCLSLRCRRCLWRVSSSQSCCDKIFTEGIFDKGARNLLFFTLISSSLLSLPHLPYYTTIYRKMNYGCLKRRGKTEVEISGAQG